MNDVGSGVSAECHGSARVQQLNRLPSVYCRSSLILAFCLCPCSVWAIDTADGNQTVVVTANRTEETLQSVPMDVSVLSGQQANAMGVTDAQSLAASVPGLLFNRQANTAIPFIRGVGSPVGEAGDEPSVAFYVDDVYEPAAAASLANFSSLDRIEVDKGPQGTVFGRNATGGVVQVLTRNPTPEPSVDLSLGLANYDTQSASVYATGQLLNTLTGNVAVNAAQQTDGWGHNAVSGEQTYTGWNYGGRAKLLWTPADRTSALLNVDFDDTRTEEGVNLRAFPGTTSFNPAGAGFPPPEGYYDTNAIPATHSITYQSGASLKVLHEFEWANFVSITAWRNTTAVEGIDEDAGIPLADAVVTTKERTWTEEIRLSSTAHAKLSWIAGLFYFHDVAGYDPLYLYGLAFLPLPYINTFGNQTTNSWAPFAQGKWEFLPATNLTLGIRYTNDHRRLDASTQNASGPVTPVSNSPQSATWSEPTYRAVLDHHFTNEVMTYIAYNRGFKSGLFNPLVLPGSTIEPPVAPEIVDAYSIGAKSDLLERRLRLDLEGFYYNYKDIQVEQILSGATHITNAAGAIIRGIDVDATISPVPHLTIFAAMEFLSGHYTSYPNGQFYIYNAYSGGNCLFSAPGSCSAAVLPPNYNSATGTWDLRGNHTVETPPFSASLTVQEEIPSAVGIFRPTANWTHTGHYYADVDNGRGQIAPSTPNNDRQGLVNLLNASLSWNSRDDRWQILAWGKNLTGVRYWSYAQENGFETQYSAAPPRTFGATFSRHW
jgi:iron complex outermembrane recepter protein